VIVGSNPAGAWISVCYDYCASSGRGLWDRPIPRRGVSYRVCCVLNVIVNNEEFLAQLGCRAWIKKEYHCLYVKSPVMSSIALDISTNGQTRGNSRISTSLQQEVCVCVRVCVCVCVLVKYVAFVTTTKFSHFKSLSRQYKQVRYAVA